MLIQTWRHKGPDLVQPVRGHDEEAKQRGQFQRDRERSCDADRNQSVQGRWGTAVFQGGLAEPSEKLLREIPTDQKNQNETEQYLNQAASEFYQMPGKRFIIHA